jgi:hypothetical protein
VIFMGCPSCVNGWDQTQDLTSFSYLEIKYFCFSGKVDQMGSAIQDHIRIKV